MTKKHYKAIEGKKPTKVYYHTNLALGSGFTSYALVDNVWYSVNMIGDVIMDVRWTATKSEIQQIANLHPLT